MGFITDDTPGVYTVQFHHATRTFKEQCAQDISMRSWDHVFLVGKLLFFLKRKRKSRKSEGDKQDEEIA